ncbi:MAG TPA: class I SAM-dependent methyltransferase [Streptosporangiaceae bacterium]|jgi:ubiquinone/menaquinone biosynthesis C-methylase UbiE
MSGSAARVHEVRRVEAEERMPVPAGPENLRRLYATRFAETETSPRNATWRVLCEDFFQKWINPGATVLEVAAGYCEFINNIKAGKKIAVDLNPEVKRRADSDVRAVVASATSFPEVPGDSIDVVFISNFFEHISKDDILETLHEVHRVLRPTGKILVLQPNIRFCRTDYWMFFDHITPLDDRSLNEALAMTDFGTEKTIVRFLPYTTKSYLPKAAFLVRAYLKVPLLWRIFGQQTFVIARPRHSVL